jgi:tRNA-dihydrouridine synthase A
MAEPGLVADCVAAMSEAVRLPVTVKHRIGIDDMDSYDQLTRFIETVSAAGCNTFIVHARKAWLQGLSPKQNREIPPLRYEMVHRLKADFRGQEFILNGGIKTMSEIEHQLNHVDGVMIGREAYQNPWLLADADRRLFGVLTPAPTRHEVVARMQAFVARQSAKGVPPHRITRHMLGLFQGQPGARAWRRHLSENAHRPNAGAEILDAALACMRP